MDQRYDWPFLNDYGRTARRWERELARGKPPRVQRWHPADHHGVGYWLRHLRYEPRDFAYAAPRRLACRLFGRHNITCHGRPSCSRFAPKTIKVKLQQGEYVLTQDAVRRLGQETNGQQPRR
ncbi:hypothetical protein [Streptomyces xanthophaeus]|uniref:hypothetical protein n=1 Tax=Streptomyces xanthophaeus TaxID=67385 RepID=UPI003667E2C8